MDNKGCVHIYCGDGKGKTTAAIGLAVRAAGRGRKVVIARFLKTDDSGEVPVLRAIPGVILLPCEKSFGFYFQMTEEQKEEAKEYYESLFVKALAVVKEEKADLLIMDEIMAACRCRLVEEAKVLAFLKDREEGLEVVLTGRDPSEEMMAAADYVSEIRKVKHPYDWGIGAREGIEY